MSHLSYEQRYSIEVLLKAEKSQTEIANIISVDKSVISREIRRNSDERNGVYRAKLAQKKYDARLYSKPKHIKINAALCSEIKLLIEQDYSPEQVAGVLSKTGETTVSHEWIYQLIWKDKHQKGTLFTHLRRKGRRYRKRGSSKDSRGQIVGRVGIEKRPKEADNRSEFGHLEVDTIIGQNHKGAIITLNDRASGMLWMGKVNTRDAETVKIKLSQMLEEIRPFIKSITGDNGKEFSQHQFITDEYCDFYFANPYSPWERGSNENLNGLVRQYIPKSSDFSIISDDRILEIQNKLNQRPRKRFGFKNPIFVMENLLFNPKVAFVA
jgi:transposase, IS30 family